MQRLTVLLQRCAVEVQDVFDILEASNLKKRPSNCPCSASRQIIRSRVGSNPRVGSLGTGGSALQHMWAVQWSGCCTTDRARGGGLRPLPDPAAEPAVNTARPHPVATQPAASARRLQDGHGPTIQRNLVHFWRNKGCCHLCLNVTLLRYFHR